MVQGQFRLVSEAHRIRLAHLFDPVLAVHTSLVHGFKSEQSASTIHVSQPGTGVFWQPVVGTHESVVHPFPSSQSSGVPAEHTPA